eukprot:c25489_g2_i1 orf=250-1566(-)
MLTETWIGGMTLHQLWHLTRTGASFWGRVAERDSPWTGQSCSRKRMSSTVNLVMIIIGFVVSSVFIIFVLGRLLYVRLQTRRLTSSWGFGEAVDNIAQIERSRNGMDPLLIDLFPTIKYSQDAITSREDAACIICLGGYEDKDLLRILPQCGHAFHVKCIDSWLRQQATCPICRVYLQNSPERSMLFPLLSEAVRSQFSAGTIPEGLFEQPLLFSNSPDSTIGRESSHECESCTNGANPDCHFQADAVQAPGTHYAFVGTENSRQRNNAGKLDIESEQPGEQSNGGVVNTCDKFRSPRDFTFGHSIDLDQHQSGKYGSWFCGDRESGMVEMETSNTLQYNVYSHDGVVDLEMASIVLSPTVDKDDTCCERVFKPCSAAEKRNSSVSDDGAKDEYCVLTGLETAFNCPMDNATDSETAMVHEDIGNQDRHSFSSWIQRS